MGSWEKYARVANACQAVEETRIAGKMRIAKMTLVSTFVTFQTPVGPMPCASTPSTGKSVIVQPLRLETQRLSAFLGILTRKVREAWLRMILALHIQYNV